MTHTSLKNVQTLSYSLEAWETDSYRLFVERVDPAPCPQCGRTGFFGPRASDPGLRYRSCRFCGFWQAVGGRPVQFRPTIHDCETWPEVARAPYVWWVDPHDRQYTCPFCHQRVNVRSHNAFMKGALVLTPLENLDHPWRKVPQRRPYSYYLRFWENWPFTKGRVIL